MPDRHRERKSKYTVDRQMPGAFEGETVTRRSFMNLTAQGAGIVAVASFTLPALGFALGAGVHRVNRSRGSRSGPPSMFPETRIRRRR